MDFMITVNGVNPSLYYLENQGTGTDLFGKGPISITFFSLCNLLAKT
jgi:hypothetical protein